MGRHLPDAYFKTGHELGIVVKGPHVVAGHSSVNTTCGYERLRLGPSLHPLFAIAPDIAQ